MSKDFLLKILISILFFLSSDVFSSENSRAYLSLSDYLEMKSSLKEWGVTKRKNLEEVSKISYKDFKLAFEEFKKDFIKELSQIDSFKKKA